MAATKDYRFDLPVRQIAQNPAEKRDNARLMIIDRQKNTIEHKYFYDISNYLRPGDLLVVNESKVFPARLVGERESTKGAVEFLLLEQKGEDIWEIIMKPGRKGKKDAVFSFGDGRLKAKILQSRCEETKLAEFYYDKGDMGETFFDILDSLGKVPLPPYISEGELRVDAKLRYQTVYASPEQVGSAAAPTAGLHFTEELLDRLKSLGVVVCPITLHVGLGTFRPVKSENISGHKIHEERYCISQASADQINRAKSENRRVVAVGTTSCRTLEGNFAKYGKITACEDKTGIFIHGDFKFMVTDALITNFHLPESTLLMLVSAFYNREAVLAAYRVAVENNYRFYSFGDAMLLY